MESHTNLVNWVTACSVCLPGCQAATHELEARGQTLPSPWQPRRGVSSQQSVTIPVPVPPGPTGTEPPAPPRLLHPVPPSPWTSQVLSSGFCTNPTPQGWRLLHNQRHLPPSEAFSPHNPFTSPNNQTEIYISLFQSHPTRQPRVNGGVCSETGTPQFLPPSLGKGGRQGPCVRNGGEAGEVRAMRGDMAVRGGDGD